MTDPSKASRDPSVARTEPAEVPLRDLVLYAGPIFGLTTTLFFVQFYFLKFAADVLLVAPGIVGAIFALGRVWDAISDPLVGTLSDRTRTRMGRRRPWMLAGIPLLAIAFAMTWRRLPEPPGPISSWWKFRPALR